MADHPQSRRDFLSTSAALAGLAGLAAMSGCSSGNGRIVLGGESLPVPQGPTPPKIAPGATIRLGFIGTGGRGMELMNRITAQPNTTIVAVADIHQANRDRAAKLAEERFKIKPEFYTEEDGYKKLLAREDLDAVVLASPCHLHGPMYLDCFAAGKHFYGEKPMAITAAEANALVEAQKKNPEVIAQIGFQRRANKRYQIAMKRLHDGEFGEPLAGYGAWNIRGPIGLPHEPNGRVWLGRRAMSGDWMLEQACHTWDVFNWAMNAMPVAASGGGRPDMFKHLDPERDVTDLYFATLEYPGGVFIDYEHSWFTPHKDNGGWGGVFERLNCRNKAIAFNEGVIYPHDDKDREEIKAKVTGDATTDGLIDFLECVRTGRKPVSGVENGRMATLTGLLVRKAVYERRWVKMTEIV